jgi:carotenoid 1,2-hydratase
LSDDGCNGLTIIGFVGSVFSPYYYRARQHGKVDPENFCSINVALYGRKRRWVMTERSKRYVARDETHFRVGPSEMMWCDNTLSMSLDERSTPLPFSLKGEITLSVDKFYDHTIDLDAKGKHKWQAIAPHASIHVALAAPKLNWKGVAYHDMNWGDEPLETGFREWNWQRAHTREGAEIFYNATRRNGSRLSFGLSFADGVVSDISLPTIHDIGRSKWGVARAAVSASKPQLVATLEDTPFYARSHLRIGDENERCEAFQESLSLDRFTNPLIQRMLPYRMSRRA